MAARVLGRAVRRVARRSMERGRVGTRHRPRLAQSHRRRRRARPPLRHAQRPVAPQRTPPRDPIRGVRQPRRRRRRRRPPHRAVAMDGDRDGCRERGGETRGGVTPRVRGSTRGRTQRSARVPGARRRLRLRRRRRRVRVGRRGG